MNTGRNKCVECRIKSTAASVLNNDELNLLGSCCKARVFKRGEIIFKEGEPAGYIAYIREGFFKQYKNPTGDKEQMLNIVKRGSYLGLHNLVPGMNNSYMSARAIKKSTVCLIDKKCFSELLKSNGEFASRVISGLCEDEIFFVNHMLKNRRQQLYGRLADALLYLRHVVYATNPFMPGLTRSDMASFIGASRESLTRALKDFQDSGLIRIESKKIFICNELKLKDLTQKG